LLAMNGNPPPEFNISDDIFRKERQLRDCYLPGNELLNLQEQ
jgi:hypothetical protein